MSKNLKIVGIQADLVWQDPQSNRNFFEKAIAAIDPSVDLIVLPEMFATGFSMEPEGIADTGEMLEWMIAFAKKRPTAIAGSLMVYENGKYYNRFYFVRPDGTYDHYDKRHRFTLAGEHKVYERGNSLKIVEYKGWKIALQICYDLRFPVFSRNVEGYDLLLYVANWPDRRIFAWDTLLRARAIENMAYVMGLNRVGMDGNGHTYTGHSGIYDYLGKELASALPADKSAKEETATITATLSRKDLQETRKTLNFLTDRDSFLLEGGL